MRNFTIYLVTLLCLFFSKLTAQESFESKAKKIAENIEWITREQKALLKVEVEEVNSQLEKGEITIEQANLKKQQLAQARAIIIENKVAVSQLELKNLVQEKVDGKIKTEDTISKHVGPSIKISFGDRKAKSDTLEKAKIEKRTTSQFVFAAGLNNLVTNGTLENSDYRFIGSHFYEVGVTYNTRILKSDNLLHAKYGFSIMYNNLRPTDNRTFVANGEQTNLEVNPINMKDSRFKNVYLVLPVHLEFDFSGNRMKDDKPFFKTHQSVRLGIGGYAGINLKSKQILKFDDDDLKAREKTKGDFNTSNFIYGLSTYVGYKSTSLYLKYDLNPLFQNNVVDQNNVSLGIRFDLN
ncbi:hypothetical protein SAMN05444372_109114 [Flavobacterium micromati]|uniref:Outer membrane protein beta-barrel domain-containing protein n=1 Tax=Flavobacterium micromati TaxID=229205 RepID=A0A1M5MCN3_9FLAO|nr:hypothetical protein [Flavobacterium micromati]SHG74483.1 hypothetical protein SAMN05444372_109114 [Flavobacterium micromati]